MWGFATKEVAIFSNIMMSFLDISSVLQDAGRGRKRKYQAAGSAGGESPMYGSGAWREDSGKVIAEAGMILRDPSALHLIIQQVTTPPLAASADYHCGVKPHAVWCTVAFPQFMVTGT